MNFRIRFSYLFVCFLCSCEYFTTNPTRDVSIYNERYLELMKAAEKEDLNKMEKIINISHLNLNFADGKVGLSLLNWCLFNEKEKSFEKLLQLGADPNWQDFYGKFAPPIIEASQLEISNYLKLCLKYGGNPNLILKKGAGSQSPLAGAIYPKSMDNLKILVSIGADLNICKDTVLGTPLAEALGHCKISKVKFLIDNGADYNNLKFRKQSIEFNNDKEPIVDKEGNPIMVYGKEVKILDFLQECQFPLNSSEYKTKMEILDFLKNKGLDYKN
jgi:hypothetical protein